MHSTASGDMGANSTGVRKWKAFTTSMGLTPHRPMDTSAPLAARLQEEWLCMRFIAALVEDGGVLPTTAASCVPGQATRRHMHSDVGLEGVVWYGMVWRGLAWYGMVWCGVVWYGMVWYGVPRRAKCRGVPMVKAFQWPRRVWQDRQQGGACTATSERTLRGKGRASMVGGGREAWGRA